MWGKGVENGQTKEYLSVLSSSGSDVTLMAAKSSLWGNDFQKRMPVPQGFQPRLLRPTAIFK